MDWTSPGMILAWVIGYLIVAVVVGNYYGRLGAGSETGYLVAGRRLGMVPVALSVIATIMSGGIFLGTVGLFFNFGANFMGYMFGHAFLGVLTVWLAGRRLWPLGSAFDYATPQDFYGHFYQSDLLRLGGAIVSILFLLPYFASGGVALGIVLETFANIPYTYGVLLMLAGTVAYSLRGGMSSIAYTDVLQGTLALVFGVIAVIGLLGQAGGLGGMLTADPSHTSFATVDFQGFMVFASWIFFIGVTTVAMPDRQTRLIAASGLGSIRDASRLLVVLLPLMTLLLMFLGFSLHVIMPDAQPDQALPEAVQQYLPFLAPLLVVVIWSTGMSTIDSGLVGATAMFSRDIYRGYIHREVNQERLLWICRGLMVVMALLALWIAQTRPPLIWNLIGYAVGVFIQVIPLLFGALYWRRASKPAAEISWVVGVVLTVVLTTYASLPPGIFAGVVALIPNAVLFVVISLLTPPLPEEHREQFYQVFAEAERGGAPAGQPAGD